MIVSHGRRRNFSRGDKNIFQRGELQKKTQGVGLFSKLRVCVKGVKNFLPQLPFWKKISLKKIILKLDVFLTYFMGLGGGSPGWVIFFLREGNKVMKGQPMGIPPCPHPRLMCSDC